MRETTQSAMDTGQVVWKEFDNKQILLCSV